jgi:hypothetical protein
MPNFHFSPSSLSKLEGVDPRLQVLAKEVLRISPIDFAITSGLRTTEEQYKLYKEGKSKCNGIKNISKHQEGKAIDICPCIYDDKLKKSVLDYGATDDLFFIIGLFYAKAIEHKEFYRKTKEYEDRHPKISSATRLEIYNIEITRNIDIRLGALWDCNSIKENRIKNKNFVDGYHIELI